MSVTAIHMPFKKDFEPLVLPGENVAIAKSLDETTWEFYRVKYVEPFFLEYTTGSIVAGSSSEVTITDLELNDNELAQVRVSIQTTGIELEVKLPEATSKYSTKRKVHRLPKWVTDTYPWLTEITYLADMIPKFIVHNTTGAATTATLRFIGFRYILEELPTKPDKYTIVYVETVASPGG